MGYHKDHSAFLSGLYHFPCLFLGATAGTLVYVDNYTDAGTATHLSVAEAGTYRIVVDGRDAENLTYTITKL